MIRLYLVFGYETKEKSFGLVETLQYNVSTVAI
jgi:hypothetical protein